MAIAIVALLAFGGSYAYFTATAKSATGTATTALIKLSSDTETMTAATENALPGEDIFKTTITLDNESTRASVLFAKIQVKFGDETITLSDDSKLVVTLDPNWTAVADQAGVYSCSAAAETDKTFVVDIALADTLSEEYIQGTTTTTQYMNKTVSVTVKFCAVQDATGSTTAADAYANAPASFKA